MGNLEEWFTKNGEKYFAWADAVESVRQGEIVVRLDLVTEKLGLKLRETPIFSEFRGWYSPMVIEGTLKKEDVRRLEGMNRGKHRKCFETGRWYELRMGDQSQALDWSPGYFSDGGFQEEEASGTLGIIDATPVDGRTKDGRALFTAFSLASFRAADEQMIRNLFPEWLLSGETYLVVFNVGQGSCASLCAEDLSPLVFFDMGGGVARNARTCPKSFRPDFSRRPPIVLSHWDMDHWVGGRRYQRALESKWLVPDQHMGPSHRALACELEGRGNLIVWPKDLNKVTFPWGTIAQLGKHRNRNYSGLVVMAQVGDRNDRVLLPGDTPYGRIPGELKTDLQLLVATHHGGLMRNDMPPPASCPNTVFYSYGENNSYGHPHEKTLQKHRYAGWTNIVRSPEGTVVYPVPPRGVTL